MAGFGVSFVPGGQGDPTKQMGQGQAGGAPPLQQAIQMLSLRLPRVVGANGLAPGPLLSAPGGMGQPGGDAALNPLLQALLRLAGMSGGGGSMAPGGPSIGPGTAPMARVTPGEGETRPGPQLMPPMPPSGGGGFAPDAGRQMGPGAPTFPGTPAGSPFLNRGPFQRGM